MIAAARNDAWSTPGGKIKLLRRLVAKSAWYDLHVRLLVSFDKALMIAPHVRQAAGIVASDPDV